MLKIVNLRSGYGSLRVIDGISLHVKAGEIVTLIGANGAGKSTLLKTVAGLLPATEGRVLFEDKDIAGWPAERIAAFGLTLVPEGRGLFPGMTVLDNLRMGGYARHLKARQLDRRVEQACAVFPVLSERLSERAGHLSGGQQQMLALARALVGQPKALLLDEPSTGLAPLLVTEVLQKIQQLKSSGLAILLAEQNVQGALRISDRAYVMKTGRVALDGPAAELMKSEEINQAYLGR